jgi:hypothetical protein
MKPRHPTKSVARSLPLPGPVTSAVEISLKGNDPVRSEQLAHFLNAERKQERQADARRRWTTVMAVASAPLAIATASPAVGRPLVEIALALWTTACLAALSYGLGEWRSRRSARALLAKLEGRVLPGD